MPSHTVPHAVSVWLGTDGGSEQRANIQKSFHNNIISRLTSQARHEKSQTRNNSTSRLRESDGRQLQAAVGPGVVRPHSAGDAPLAHSDVRSRGAVRVGVLADPCGIAPRGCAGHREAAIRPAPRCPQVDARLASLLPDGIDVAAGSTSRLDQCSSNPIGLGVIRVTSPHVPPAVRPAK